MCRFIETLCIEQEELKNVEYHNRRMNETRHRFWKSAPLLRLEEFVFPQGCVSRTRCRLTYGREVESIEYFPYHLRRVNSLRLVEGGGVDYRFKWADRSVLDCLFAQRGEADEVLIVQHGLLTDTSIANIALWNGKEWHTPSVPLLRGTHRQRLLEEEVIHERPIEIARLSEYSRIRLFNAMIRFGEVELPVANIIG